MLNVSLSWREAAGSFMEGRCRARTRACSARRASACSPPGLGRSRNAPKPREIKSQIGDPTKVIYAPSPFDKYEWRLAG